MHGFLKFPIIRWQRFILVLAFLLASASALAEKLNIVLIMADDSAVDNYSCYGSDFFQSPRLDHLAETGARFNYCYSEPVCTSSRVKIMTGRDGVRNYVNFGTLDKSETTFGTMLKNAGYATAVAGKWQLQAPPNGSLPEDCGFDAYCLWNIPGTGRERYWKPSLNQNGTILDSSEQDYGPDIVSDFLVDFMEENRERPFFVYYPMILVHNPFPETPDSRPATKEEAACGKGLKNYRDMVAYADKLVGKLVDAVNHLGLREKTVFIYTADNGTNRSLTYPFNGAYYKGEKAYTTEGGYHVPLIVNCPTVVPSGIVNNDLIDFSDVLPTLAELTGAKLPKVKLDGRSFWAQCLGKEGDPKPVITQYYYPKYKPAAEMHGLGIRDREIIWAQNQHFKLYQNGFFYSVADRFEVDPIAPGDGTNYAEETRAMLQKAIDAMPQTGQMLKPEYGN